jgi:hypothetical protein
MKSIILLGFSFIFLGNCNFKVEEGFPSVFKGFFGTTQRITPQLTSILPKDKSTGNFRNTGIYLVFNTDMDLASAKQTFTLTSGSNTPIQGEVTVERNVVSFIPKEYLTSNGNFTVTMKAGASSVSGGALGSDLVNTFGTGTLIDVTPPTVSSTSPIDASTGFPINATITATFSETINPASFNSGMFTITGVTGVVSLNDSTISFKPSSNLPINTQLVARITGGVKDLANNTMTNSYVWSFTTGSTTASDCVFGVSLIGSCLIK